MTISLLRDILSFEYTLPAVGIAAAILTTSSFLPQIIKGYKTKKLDDLSRYLMIMFSTGTVLWIIYGIFKNDLVIIGANSIASALNVVLLVMKFSYRKNSRTEAMR